MKTKDSLKVNEQDAQEICAKIREEAQRQVADILARADKEAQRILAQARQEAENKKAQMLKDLDQQLTQTKEKILSTLNLEKKKIILEEKNKFAQQVLESLIKESEGFRNSKDYPDFLKKAIMEGAGVIDAKDLDVFYSSLDVKTVSDSFIKEITALASDKFKDNLVFRFHKSDFKDIGVIVQSGDGHLSYDNRFLSRLKRVQDDIYMKLLKEAF
jgi:V/A-type H+-transporting ATPase subunit E